MDALVDALEHDPEKHAPHLIRTGDRVFLVTNTERICAEIMFKK
jgi:hypothetical protein